MTSPETQNEILKIMALTLLRTIAAGIHESPYFTVMIDETTDITNKEQCTVCIRWVDKNLEVFEDFIGFWQVSSIDANTLVSVIRDVLLRMNLSISKCRGQCFDGASVMTGIKNGVATLIANEEKRAVFIHCYGHALNLAIGDAVKNSSILKDALDIAYEISKLIQYSPKRQERFDRIKG